MGTAGRCLAILALLATAACGDAEAATAGCASPSQDVMPSLPAAPSYAHRSFSIAIDRADVAAVDRDPSYRKWPSLPEAARALLVKTLPNIDFMPSDVLEVGWLSSDSTFGGETIITETLGTAPWPTFPPPPALEEIRPDLFCRQVVSITERNNAKIHAYTEAIGTSIAGWKTRQQELADAFVARAVQALKDAPLIRDAKGTDVAGAVSKGASVAHASGASSGVVLLLTDMTGPLLPIADLHNITIVVALYDRRGANDRSAGEREWTEHLRSYGAIVPPFLSWTDTTEATLLARLKGGPRR
ncbi:MAG: hypothetical protein KGJ98_12120 [Chloroflexota bacterium]|nr:hypothetical protein [Chloroflexota bacterium]